MSCGPIWTCNLNQITAIWQRVGFLARHGKESNAASAPVLVQSGPAPMIGVGGRGQGVALPGVTLTVVVVTKAPSVRWVARENAPHVLLRQRYRARWLDACVESTQSAIGILADHQVAPGRPWGAALHLSAEWIVQAGSDGLD